MQTFILAAVLLCSLGAVSAGWKYKFKPFTSQANCLTVTGGGNGDGNGYSVATCDAANTYQNFEELQLQGNTALLTLLTGMSECSAKALAGVAGTAPNGAPTELVKQMSWNPSNKAHYWTQQAQGLLPGYFWLKNLASGMCATAESLGTYVDDYACTGGAIHQLWSLSDPNAPTWGQGSTLNNQLYIATNPCLKVNGANPGSNVGTSTAACAAGDYSQAFYPIRQNGTHWKAVGSSRCIDGGGSASLAYQYACVGTAQNQQWIRFNYPGEGVPANYFMDILSGLCLTWDPASATNIHTEACVQGNTNQQWYTDLVGI